MSLRMTLELIVPWNSYLALLAVKWLFTIMWLHMYCQVTPLDTSCPTLSWVCVAIRGFQWLPAPHCLQLTIFFLSSMYTLMLLQVTTSYKSCSTFFADKLFSSSMCLHTTLKLIAKLYRGPGRSTIAWPLSTAVHTLHPACLGELTWGRLPSR